MLTILSVAYPFAPVGPNAVGGAEQVLGQIDVALARAGHHSIVLAREDSHTAGTLVAMPRITGLLTDERIAAMRERYRHAVAATLGRWRVDVVHLHGVDFHSYLPPAGVPALATLHLPISWYSDTALHPRRPDTWLHCVSESQQAGCGPNPHLLSPIENGVSAEFLSSRHAKRDFALVLARICPEKGIHHAIAAAKRGRVPLLIGGEVFPYGAHQHYFRSEIVPRLDRSTRFLGPVRLRRKRRLLAAARCVLIPSLAPETSSLVAREALASGTPVIAFARGALVDTIEHGRTGFLVEDERQMGEAIAKVAMLDPQECRRVARSRFSLERMTKRYLALYESLGRMPRQQVSGAA